ncbi:hypothetical protein [Amycolatopsis sp. NPDC051128]|uniref:hypothetical protein n=1 Tax=Amycolatopsis sp. NPDC051128 TaxID=3155412 RepID=UPI0034382CF7
MGATGPGLEEATEVIKESRSPDQVTLRPQAQVSTLFTGFAIVESGLAGCGEWRPSGLADISDAAAMKFWFTPESIAEAE